MQFQIISIGVVAALTGVAVARDEPLSNPSATQSSPRNLNPTEDEVFPQVYKQFLAEEMDRVGADYAEDENDVLNGAISWSLYNGRHREVEALQRIQAWKEQNKQSSEVERRSLESSALPYSYPTANSTDTSGGLDDEGSDAEVDAWVDQFMSGQPVDDNLLWRSSDLTEKKPDDGEMTVNVTSAESKLAFWLAAMQFHTQWALSLARYRARLASNTSAVFEQQDKTWAASFLSGEPIDENMIFSMDDLQTAIDEIDDLLGSNITSVASSTTATATLTSPVLQERATLTKRHPPTDAVQVINRVLNAPKNAKQVLKRALRKARHRAKRAEHSGKSKHNKQKAHKHKNHKNKHHDKHANHQPKSPKPENHKHGGHKHKNHNKHKHHNNQNNQQGNKHPHKGHKSNQPCWAYNRYYFCFVDCYQKFWGSHMPTPQCINPSKGGIPQSDG